MIIQQCESLTDFHRIIKNRIANSKRILICYLDGFGWNMYEKAKEKNQNLFMEDRFLMLCMKTVTPAITNAAMATMLTGKEPKEHGVTSHKIHKTACKTMFADCKEDAALIEGDILIIQTEIKQKLCTASKERTIDAAVFEETKKAIASKKQMIFSHFHGIDDMAHDHGPYAEETMRKIEELDGYIRQLASIWDGELYLISDHGLHETEDGQGTHGTDMPEDQEIPFGIYLPKQQISIEELQQLLWPEYNITQIQITGNDGYMCACDKDTWEADPKAYLQKKENSWRFVIPSDTHSKRWCKDIEEVGFEI